VSYSDGAASPHLPALPNGWQYHAVSELGAAGEQAVLTGPFGTNLGRDDFIASGVPLLTIGCLTESGINLDKALFVSEAKAAELERYRLKEGDLLFSRMASVGRAGLVTKALQGALFNYHIMRLRLDREKIEARVFINYVRGATQVRNYLKAVNHGATRDGINTEQLLGLPVAVPPLYEQSGIVAEIEKQFSRLDEAVANLQRVKANLQRCRASVLKSAVTGVLLPNADAGSWRQAQIGDVADVIGGLTKNPKRDSLPKKLPYLRVANVYANELRLENIERIGVRDEELPKLLLRSRDLLVVEGNGSPDQIGRVALWDGSIPNCVHQNHLIKVRFGENVMPEWALLWLLSPGGRGEIQQVAASTSGLHTLSTGKVSRLPMPVPPLSQQRQIVSEVDRRLSIFRELEVALEANLKRARALREVTLSSTFS
jgi:type I restriction enzyme, S subunit